MAYKNLCQEFYDISKPSANKEEVDFYADLIKKANGPVLEAMCGSGRLLLPLLRLGFLLDGLDNSSEMLASCQKRGLKENLKVSVFLQSIEVPTSRKYALIFIAIGSFQLIRDRNQALETLKILRSELLPHGSLILDTYIPWDSIKVSIQEDSLLEKIPIITSTRSVECPDGSQILLQTKTEIDPLNQLEISKNHYQKISNGNVVAEEDEELSVRWYYPYEMELLLKSAGFEYVEMEQHDFGNGAHSLVYKAY